MKTAIFAAVLLALPLWGCADEDPDQSGDNDAAADAAPGDDDAGGTDGGATGDDGGGGGQDAGTAADAAADASPGADASTPADSGAAGDAAADAGATVDSGADAGPQPTVIWTKRTMATTNLGAIGSQPYHHARFGWNSPTGCSLLVDTAFYATDYTGTTILTLTSAQQACLRNQFDCSVQTKVVWSSCGMASGCTTFQAGLVWQTDRPACVVTIPPNKALMLRHTVAALGPAGLDETWELVTP